MNQVEERIKEVYDAAMQAAVTDEEFRAALLTDPKAAIEKLTGTSLPEGFKLKVLEKDPDCDMTILLPPMIFDELSEEDMNQVAGGMSELEQAYERYLAGKLRNHEPDPK